jgi:hypothetical protein
MKSNIASMIALAGLVFFRFSSGSRYALSGQIKMRSVSRY